VRRRGFASLARAAAQDLFDQKTAFGRLALVHVIMNAGDTLVTVSLAGSLFFSVSPDEAKSKVLLYLLLTFAPFAVVSPVLGPLIDKSANGRRILVALSAGMRVVLCWSMSMHLKSLWLFPEAFFVLVFSKLYGVTRGALVPEMARTDQFRERAAHVGDAGWPEHEATEKEKGFAGFNAQLTLLGTLSGLVAGSIGAGILKGIGGPAVLITASLVYAVALVASLRLQRPAKAEREQVESMTQLERDRQMLTPLGDTEVAWGLSASAIMRFTAGFSTFLLAFGLRREEAGLKWFAFALSMSALGSLIGLGVVTRVRNKLPESALLTGSLLLTGVGSALASLHPTLVVQVSYAGWLGIFTAIAQPSFDAITQRFVPAGSQGRTFARFAVRQQLLWVVGALIPVGISLHFKAGDVLLAVLTLGGGLIYGIGRRFSHQ
jgi:hypothetical protein